MVNAEENKLSLNTLANSGTKKNRKRVGRGIGSGWAKLLVEVIKDKNQDLVGE